MTTFYKADSIRIANYQSKKPNDIGKFRPRVIAFTPHAYVGEDDEGSEVFVFSLPNGSIAGQCADEADALQQAAARLIGAGWVTDKAVAEAEAIEHAKARRERRPKR